jgi:UDP-N-acetylmuramoyl-L-alanyl-D-glutamate--2,6-diaminopimelate ligase
MRTLRELLQDLPYAKLDSALDVAVTGIAYDSRMVKPGELFVALPGFHVDGVTFIPDAVRRGAAAVVTQRPEATAPERTPLIRVPDTRRALADLSAAFYGYPARQLRVVGVTGTDGKTTVTHLASAVMEAMGYRTGFVTTADVKVGERISFNDTQHTTPEPVEMQALLREMVDEGVHYAVLESSSHALALDRLLHCEFDAAVFTNVSPEHLNFHGSMENYARDKARLFALLDQGVPKGIEKVAILNADDPHSAQMRSATRARAVWYGLGPDAGGTETRRHEGHEEARRDDPDSPLPRGREGQGTSHSLVTATNVQLLPTGSRFRLVTPAGAIDVESRLPGRFNVYNWLAASSLALSQGGSLEQIREAMARVDGVPGRMQAVKQGQPFAVVVDFAHTPQGMRTVLGTLRALTPGRLFVLFGMAGERDPSNRPEMGRAVAEVADFALLTTDDPRFEDPMEIAEQVAAGARSAGWREGENYQKIGDREEAIREAFRRARPGDTVLLAGKGHEQRMVIGAELLPWNDAEAARRVLADMGYGE